MFDPLTPEDVCRALAGLLRDSADNAASGHDDQGFARTQLLAASSLARLLAIELSPEAVAESEMRRGISATLDGIEHPIEDHELAVALEGLRTAIAEEGWSDPAGASLSRVLAILRERPDLDTEGLGRQLRHVVRSSIDQEIAVFAGAS